MPGAMIAGVIPLAFLTAGLVALAAGAVVLRSFGPRYRIGRLLATAPRVTVAEAVQLADAGPRYVAVEGRIDAEEPFEDDAHRPLVFRRTRLEQRTGSSGWTAFEDHREAVTFTVREGLDEIGIDTDALDSGLIVVRREAVGTAADVHERAGDLPPDTAVRLRIEQVSAVEHAIAVGVPRRDTDGGRGPPDGGPWPPADRDDARAGGSDAHPCRGSHRPTPGGGALPRHRPGARHDRVHRGRGRRAAVRRALATAAAAVVLLLISASRAFAAEPAATPGTGGDPRSPGQGPGLVGDPLFAIGAVALVAVVSIALTSGTCD